MNPDLDDLLTKSAPPLTEASGLGAAVHELVDATRVRRVQRRSRRRGVLLGTTTAGVVLAGSAAAAALTIGGWSAPWASDPDGALQFKLPSGTPCEWRIGNIHATDSDLADELRSWLDDHTLAEVADIDSTLQSMRGPGWVWQRNDGTEVAVGYGTEYYDEDAEYVQAVHQAISLAISDKAEEIGLPDGVGRLGHEGEVKCVGKEDPSTPSWMR